VKTISENKISADALALGTCVVLSEDGKKKSLRSLWEKQSAIFVFLRHFACDACRSHALEVWENRDKYQAHGAQIHFIGNGAPQFLKAFKDQFGLQSASFYTDPTLKSFKAAGFRKGFWIDPGEMYTRSEFLWLAVKHQMRQTGQGNVWQLGGVLVVKPGGKIAYQFTSQTMGHFPPTSDIPRISDLGNASETEKH
jgi:peroxiredoxin